MHWKTCRRMRQQEPWAQAPKHATWLQLMFNKASRQPLLIPLDISRRPMLDSLSVVIRICWGRFNHVALHQFPQVIKKPPCKQSGHFLFQCIKTFLHLMTEMRRDKLRDSKVQWFTPGENCDYRSKGGHHQRSMTFTAAVFKERLSAFIALLGGRRVEMKSRADTKVKQEEKNLVDHILRVILFLWQSAAVPR